MEKEWVNIKEAVEITGLKRTMIYYHFKKGTLITRKSEQRKNGVEISIDSLKSFMEEQDCELPSFQTLGNETFFVATSQHVKSKALISEAKKHNPKFLQLKTWEDPNFNKIIKKIKKGVCPSVVYFPNDEVFKQTNLFLCFLALCELKQCEVKFIDY